jgi:hypothetical protein
MNLMTDFFTDETPDSLVHSALDLNTKQNKILNEGRLTLTLLTWAHQNSMLNARTLNQGILIRGSMQMAILKFYWQNSSCWMLQAVMTVQTHADAAVMVTSVQVPFFPLNWNEVTTLPYAKASATLTNVHCQPALAWKHWYATHIAPIIYPYR